MDSHLKTDAQRFVVLPNVKLRSTGEIPVSTPILFTI